jgi:uncharacterized protein (DUF1330 family)
MTSEVIDARHSPAVSSSHEPVERSTTMNPVYAIAYLRDVRFGEEIIEYLQRIDATLAPYGGRFLVHGGAITPAEGTWDGDLVIIGFPDRASAVEWYDSPAYQEILPLRTENSRSIAALVEGVPAQYQATDKLAELLSRATG